MSVDPVVEEVRERGRFVTARYGNDPRRLLERLREMEAEDPARVVDTIRVVRDELQLPSGVRP